MSVLSILSITWKILKSCFQSYFSTFNTFFSVIINVQNFFLCRERGGVESIQMLNKWLFYRISRMLQWTRQVGTQANCAARKSWNAMKSKSQNKASFAATCRTISPSSCLCLPEW